MRAVASLRGPTRKSPLVRKSIVEQDLLVLRSVHNHIEEGIVKRFDHPRETCMCKFDRRAFMCKLDTRALIKHSCVKRFDHQRKLVCA
jgi:hypothetical protein